MKTPMDYFMKMPFLDLKIVMEEVKKIVKQRV